MGQFVQRGDAAPVWADDAELDRMLTSGYQPVDVGTVGQAVTKEDRGQGGLGGAVTAGLSSLASGATAGLSDAALAALASKGTTKDVAAAREAHPVISFGSNVIGALAPAILSGGAAAPESFGALGSEGLSLAGLAEAAPVNLISRAGGAVSEAVGGGLGGRVLGGATEGALFGAGQGVSDLALGNDPLTAENIAGHISSSALLGAGIGGGLSLLSKGVESALDRAGAAIKEAGEAKAALAAVPGDLAQLDEKGLKDALKVATVEHEASKQAEVDALEQVRSAQRKDLVKDIDSLHEDMRSSKLYQAINDDFANGAKPEAIDGITVAQKQIAQANSQIGKLKLNPIGLADNPTKVLDGLQKQQSALETIQANLPKLRTTLADNTAGAGLDFVDQALERTKAQIDAVKALDSKLTPVNSPKLQLLKAGPSERMEQIQSAQQALKDGKTLGIVGTGVQKIAKTAATGIGFVVGGHMPGGHLVGAAAGHWLGERAAGAVGWMARKLSGTAAKAAETTAGHIDTFLSTAKQVGTALKAPAVANATKVLSNVRFSSDEQKPESDDLRGHFIARSKELKQQTFYAPDGSVQIQPEARQRIAATFDGMRTVAPVLADKLESNAVARVIHASSTLPRKPDSNELVFGPDKWAPSNQQIHSWANTVRALEDPASVEQRLAHGVMTPEEATAYRTVYPQRFEALQQKVFQAAPTLSKTLPMQKKIALSIFTGVPLVRALQPNVLSVIQATFAVEPGTAGGTQSPRAAPQFGSHGTPKDIDKPTPAQERQT